MQATDLDQDTPVPVISPFSDTAPPALATSIIYPTLASTAEVTLASVAQPNPECGPGWCIYPGHFLFQRPIWDEPFGQVDPTYRYGSTAGGVREPHTGVEFQAPADDAVLAVAQGKVAVVVREDEVPGPGLGAGYGNMVILQHVQPGSAVPVFSLYGHLSEIDVFLGQVVQPGSLIGRVGATGFATGPHLHFEVRVGSDRQADARNPELWLLPSVKSAGENNGAVAGRIQTADGKLVESDEIVIQPIDPDSKQLSLPAVYLQTYAGSRLHGDDAWDENFAAGDIQPGSYRLAFTYGGKFYTGEAPVQAGKLTMINFTVDLP